MQLHERILQLSSIIFWLMGVLNTYNIALSSLSYLAAIFSAAIASAYYVRKHYHLKKNIKEDHNENNHK